MFSLAQQQDRKPRKIAYLKNKNKPLNYSRTVFFIILYFVHGTLGNDCLLNRLASLLSYRGCENPQLEQVY